MTNYNERLDEVLNSGDGILHCCGDYQEEAKQAIISLIKELVEEAKPEIKTQFFCQGCDKSEERGYNQAIKEFEQNLLKALEEV